MKCPKCKADITEFFANFGKIGGKKSKRKLTAEQSRAMLNKRKDRQK